jgi:hypothetical protein
MEGSSHTSMPVVRRKEDWILWKFVMRNRLRAEGSLEIVEEKAERPHGPEKVVVKWDERNARAMDLLGRSVAENYLKLIMHCESSAQIWSTLCGLCETRDAVHLQAIQQRYFDYRYTPGVNMQEYISTMVMNATDCRSVGLDVSDEQVMAKMLAGVPPSFEALIYAFESRSKEEQTLENLSKLLLRKESFDMQTNATSATGPNTSNSRGESHALSTQVQESSGARQGRQFSGNCYKCGKRGHFASRCRSGVSNRGTASSRKHTTRLVKMW